MVSCKQCQTPNSLDSTFCKRCGAAIAESDLTEAQAKMEQLIEEGNALFNQGRTDEALAIAEAAVLANPSSTSGWSLKTLCHERRGEIAEALECADRLVELNPSSDFDKIRRGTLRQKLQTDLQLPAAPDRRLATLGAISAVVLVLCVGAIVARLGAAGNPTASRTTTTPVVDAGNPQTQIQNSPAATPTNTNPVVNNQAPPQTTGNQGSSTPVNTNPLRYEGPPANVPTYRGPSLPSPNEFPNGEVAPLNPQIDPSKLEIKSTAPQVQTQPKDDGGEPKPLLGGPPVDVTPPKQENQGVIEISVHRGGGSTRGSIGGSEPVTSTGVDAMTRVGNQQFLMGNFEGAVKSYEQAVQSGGDAIALNRRLGQAYERLGRNSDAVGAYQRCMSAIDGALASGKGDKDRLASTRGVCEQAVKVLQGG